MTNNFAKLTAFGILALTLFTPLKGYAADQVTFKMENKTDLRMVYCLDDNLVDVLPPQTSKTYYFSAGNHTVSRVLLGNSDPVSCVTSPQQVPLPSNADFQNGIFTFNTNVNYRFETTQNENYNTGIRQVPKISTNPTLTPGKTGVDLSGHDIMTDGVDNQSLCDGQTTKYADTGTNFVSLEPGTHNIILSWAGGLPCQFNNVPEPNFEVLIQENYTYTYDLVSVPYSDKYYSYDAISHQEQKPVEPTPTPVTNMPTTPTPVTTPVQNTDIVLMSNNCVEMVRNVNKNIKNLSAELKNTAARYRAKYYQMTLEINKNLKSKNFVNANKLRAVRAKLFSVYNAYVYKVYSAVNNLITIQRLNCNRSMSLFVARNAKIKIAVNNYKIAKNSVFSLL